MKSFKRVCITLIALFCCGIVSADGLQGVGPKEEPVLKGKDKFEQVKEELGKKKDRNQRKACVEKQKYIGKNQRRACAK